MQYKCVHCGAIGADSGDLAKMPWTYHCHYCSGKNCMIPREYYNKVFGTKGYN